jgi:hypothetical protein
MLDFLPSSPMAFGIEMSISYYSALLLVVGG